MSSNLNTDPQEAQKNSIRDLTVEYENIPHMGFVETLLILARSWSFVRFFKIRFAVKWVLTLLSLMFPILVLPWTLQIMIDHVVLGNPIDSSTGYLGFPAYLHPILDLMQDMSAWEILSWLTGSSFLLVIFFGAYSNEQRDTSEADMQQGNDTATQQDNWTHGGFSFSGGITGYYEYKMNSRLTQSINHLIRAKLFHRIQSLPITTLEDQRIGDAIYRVMYDSPSINQIFYEIINRPTLSTILFIAAMATMMSAFPHVPEVVWCAAAIFPIYILITGPFSSAMRRVQEKSRHSGSITTSTIEEGMDNILAVQSLGGEDKERERFGEDSKESFKRFRFTVLVEILLANAQGLGGVLILTIAFWLVISRVIDGELTPGNYGSLMFFFGWMAGPAISFATLWIHLQRFAPGMRRVFALMDLPVEEDLGHLRIDTISEDIEIKGAGLVYPDGRRALKDVSFEAKIGQIVAFVGPTGSGKTSLAYLLPRYHMATEGEVFIDGVDVRDIKIESLRSQITYVFQETQLFSLSIFDNICFGKPEASQAEVERVAKIAGIHDFIISLPEGYETKLGSTAISKLSVGQKQRIAIARGLLRDSKILILDEPTSALDPETEQFLVNALKEASKDRLVIIIAHRLSTIANADKIIFLEDGVILEQGSPGELMSNEDSHYRNYVRLQTDFSED
jgi:ABC-type multidrug transport system fused ATPase/permease subunit|tara:strand:- start:412 stop:2448 length:2037 start_codon:yes stop_codon:yes gene_type:complete